MLTSIKLRFTARRVPGGLLLLRDRATGGHGHARLLKFGQRALDFAKLPGFLLSGGRANGHGHYPVHPYSVSTPCLILQSICSLQICFYSSQYSHAYHFGESWKSIFPISKIYTCLNKTSIFPKKLPEKAVSEQNTI